MAWNDFLKSPQWQGGPTSILDYGINTLANKFNNYAGSNQRLDYDQSLSDWGSPMGNVPDAPRMPPMLDPTGQMGASNYRAPQGIPFHPAQGNRGRWSQANVPDERGFLGKTRDVIGNQISRFTTPVMGAMKRMVEPNTPEENFGLEYFKNMRNPSTGRVWEEWAPSNGFGGGNIATGFGKGMGARGQKRIDKINATLAKWEARAAEGDEEAIQRLKTTALRRRSDKFQTQLDAYNQDLAAATGGADNIPTTGGAVQTGGYTGPPTRSFDPVQAERAGSYSRRAGPESGSYGPWMATGGRVGYQDGELVEDEYMEEATPAGMMEENIEEVQGEPSREQLEAIAFEIFQLPLEELNEEQLEVVYQAAMEQEPSEEEVQFAAQEGPGEGIASLV